MKPGNPKCVVPAVRAWIDAHFAELQKRLASAGAGLVDLYAESMCSEEDAASLQQAFAARMQDVEGGPLELRQTVESIHLCAARRAARRGLPLF